MATYAITFSDEDDWGEASNRFKTRKEADSRLEEVQAIGRFARLIRWENNQPTEVLRINEGPQRDEFGIRPLAGP